MINVDLMDHMGDDLTVVNSARVSFDKQSGYADLYDGTLHEADQKLIGYLAKHNHWSPFSHCQAQFHVKAPIFVARQLQKHTVGFAWNEVSRRYVDSPPEFYLPDELRFKAPNVKQGSSNVVFEGFMRDYLLEGVRHNQETALQLYQELLEEGVCPEQARMVLPQSMTTEWYWTGSLYAWARMCKVRLDSHTQKETRGVAERIAQTLSDLFPVSWEALMTNG